MVHVLSESLIFIIYVYAVPNADRDIFVGELVKDAITAKYYEVVLFLDLEGSDVRFAYNHIRVAPSELILGFRVSESS